MQKIKIVILLLLLNTVPAVAQHSETVLNYIYTYKDLAIAEMKRTGVPAAITLAQGIHESGAGKSKLASTSNNHFGIKCKTSWTGEKVYHDDDARGECFRKYPAVTDSYKDHSDFLRNGQRYAFLFQLDPEDYTGWANGLKQAGYATNPKYPQVLIKLIEDYGLQHYTMLAVGKIPDAYNQQTEEERDNAAIDVKPKEVVAIILPEANTMGDKKETTQYPAGIFKINETKVVFVQKGASFLALAKQHEVDLSKLFEFNEMKVVDFAPADMLVYLQRKRKTGNNEFHIVQQGETLHDIAQKQGIRLESLRELNGLGKTNNPVAGTRLYLKGKTFAKTK